jgi:hypothetical protein
MERVYKIAQASVMPMPDSVFWYTISMALFLFAVWVAKRHIDNSKETFSEHSDLIRKMSNCLIELTTITKVHEVHIQALNKKVESHDRELDALREFYIVKYKDNGR